jgi:hypothetical protein
LTGEIDPLLPVVLERSGPSRTSLYCQERTSDFGTLDGGFYPLVPPANLRVRALATTALDIGADDERTLARAVKV